MIFSPNLVADPKAAKIAAVVNAASGRCSRATGERLRAHLQAHAWRRRRSAVTGASLPALIGSCRQFDVIVLGGDGTVRTASSAASRLTLLMPLPGGTMACRVPSMALGPGASGDHHSVNRASAPAPSTAPSRWPAVLRRGAAWRPSLLQEAREAVRHGEFALAARKGFGGPARRL